jgi:pSer/pThr/pTyr-binding forkhead associated (FHA) protein
MKRFFTILEGDGKGQSKLLDQPLMIVGRSKNADLQVEDALISRRHLEVRVEADAVFVEDKSSHGSFLNGKRLAGVVSLNAGDVIEIGRTKLRYEEREEAAAAAPAAALAGDTAFEARSVALDGTRVATPGAVGAFAGPREEEDEHPDATHALGQDSTRMADQSELPNWKPPVEEQKKKERSTQTLWVGVAAIILLAAAGAAYYFFGGKPPPPGSSGTMEFKDSLLGYSLDYPLDWSKLSDTSGEVAFGFGKEGAADWARVRIYADRQPQYALTGLTDGFEQYRAVLSKQFKEFELKGSGPLNVNDASVMFFGFGTPALSGKGLYVLNAETRIVIECFAPRAAYDRYAAVFSSVLKSFRLRTTESQQVIDFPLPEESMKQLALGSPTELARQVEERTRLADALLAERDVKPENLYRSMQAYRQALQLAIAGPQRLDSYQPAARGLIQATRLFNQALERQRFEINRALRERDRDAAYWAASRMIQMVPEKTDPAYQEAYKTLRSLQKPKGS